MKLYYVRNNNWGFGTEFRGIFSSIDKAKKAIVQYIKTNTPDNSIEDFILQEVILDKKLDQQETRYSVYYDSELKLHIY